MIKLKLYPPSGSLENSKALKFEISDVLVKSIHVNMENATHGIRADVSLFQSTGKGSYMGIMNLNIPEYSSQSAISVFAHIEEKIEEGSYRTIQICPTIFSIKEKTEKLGEDISINPAFVGPDDLCSIRINGQPESKVTISINDKLFKVIINKGGSGSIHFKTSNVIGDSKLNSVERLPVYLYSAKDNYTKKRFTGSYLNILPSTIAMHAIVDPRCDPTDPAYVTPGTWTRPSGCDESPVVNGEIYNPGPTIPPISTPTSCKDDSVTMSDDICRLYNHSATLVNNGMVLHAYLSPDKNYDDPEDVRFNINKVYIGKTGTSLDVQVIATRDVAIAPKTITGNFEIYVKEDLWDAIDVPSLSNIYAIFHNYTTGFLRVRITDKRIDEYTNDNILIGVGETNVGIDSWLFCVNSVFYYHEEEPSLYTDNLYVPYILDSQGDYLSTIRVNITSNIEYIGSEEESYVYLVAEALVDDEIQLFFYSFSIGRDSSFARENYGWRQLTYDGNNKNSKIRVDTTNNLHIVWESDRGNINQIYYGVTGIASTSLAISSVSSCVDKYSEFLSKDDRPFDYLSTTLMEAAIGDGSNLIPEYNTESLIGSEWLLDNNDENSVTITQSASSKFLNDIEITANAVYQNAMAFAPVQIVADGDSVDPDVFPYSQFNYQISFDLQAIVEQTSPILSDASWDGIIVEEKEIDKLFDEWKDGFVVSVDSDADNQPVYIKDNNRFVIGRSNNVFDRIVPFAGSYKHASVNNPSVESFQIKILKGDNNLKDFTLGLMFEKTYFKATNIETLSSYQSGDYSFPSEEHVIYTGRAKLVLLVKTEDTSDERANYIIVKEFPEILNVNEVTNYTLILNYTSISSDEVGNILDTYEQTYTNKFIGTVTLLLDSVPRFSQSFISTLSNDYNYFDVGLGIPYGGYYVADKMSPNKFGIFDDITSTLIFTDITVTSPTFIYNSNIINLPSSIRDMVKLRVGEVNPSDIIYNDLLHMGIIGNRELLTQVPISFEGINQSVNIDVGICNDAHVVWQSNRDNYWNIFYSNSVNKLSPFRFDSLITDTESNSLKPSVSVNRNGSRMVVWHDNRNENYDIYAARSQTGYSCDSDKCEREMLEAFSTNIIECSVSFDFDVNTTGTYNFSAEFYSDSGLTNLYKTISVADTFARWFVDGTAVQDDSGISLVAGNTIILLYVPDKDDEIFDMVLYTKLVYTITT